MWRRNRLDGINYGRPRKPPVHAHHSQLNQDYGVNPRMLTMLSLGLQFLRLFKWEWKIMLKWVLKDSSGTAIFCLTGKINNSGLVEIPMGTTIRTLVYEIGEGCPNNKQFKAIQIGGPSGGCIPAKFLDMPIDFKHINDTGAIFGSGGIIVLDEDTCMVELAHFFIDFTQKESCGKWYPLSAWNAENAEKFWKRLVMAKQHWII